jgi:hypothetical protein
MLYIPLPFSPDLVSFLGCRYIDVRPIIFSRTRILNNFPLSCRFTDWFFVLVLDIHNPPISSIPVPLRVSDGLMQAVAVRSGGFSIIPVAAVAPAVQVLFVIMMYISACKCCVIHATKSYAHRRYQILSP